MPELAEVEYYRRRWSPGLNRRILSVALHSEKRVFRGPDGLPPLKMLKKELLGGREVSLLDVQLYEVAFLSGIVETVRQ